MTETLPSTVCGRLPALLQRLIEGCWLAVVGVIPLCFVAGILRPFYPPKAMLLQFLALVMLAAVGARWLLAGGGASDVSVRSFLQRRVFVVAVAFGVVAIVATILSLSPWTSLVGSVNRRQGLLTILSWLVFFFVLSTNLRTRSQLLRLVVVLLVSSGIMSVIGIVEHYVPSFSQRFLSTTYTNRSAATTGNALSLSAYLGMAVPFTLAAGTVAWRRRERFARPVLCLAAIGALLALQAWCLVLSIYSFTVLLYLLPAGLFVALFALLMLRRRAVTLVALGLLAAMVAGGALVVLPQWQNAVRGTDPYERGTPLPADTPERLTGTLYGRARYWVYALDVLPQAMSNPQPGDAVPWLRPAIGYGPETYVIATQRHFPPEYLSAQTNAASFRDRAHNGYIDLAVTTGFLGLAAWLAVIAGCGVLLYRLVQREDAWSPLGIVGVAVGSAVAGFLAHGIFNPIAFAEETLLWTCLGIAVPLSAFGGGLVRGEERHVPELGGCVATLARRLVACLLLAGAVLAGALAAYGPLMGERAMREAIMMSAAGNPDTVFMYSRATELQPREPTYWGALGGYAHSIALHAEGEAKATVLDLSLIALREARRNEPLFHFWHYQLGDALLYAAASTGQVSVEQAIESYERALELSPRNAVLAGRLAVAHMFAGEWEETALALQRAAEYDHLWSETPHLEVAYHALMGDGERASQSLLDLVREKPSELRVCVRVLASRLLAYGIVEPMAATMLPALEAEGDDWAALSVRGALMALTDEPEEAAELLTAAAGVAPEAALGAVRNTTAYLAGFVPGLGDSLTER